MQNKKKVSAVILAGGFGTRLSPLTDTKPKPLVRILDTSLLDSVLHAIRTAGVKDVVVSTHYKAEEIVKECEKSDMHVKCIKEEVPLGTAGGVRFCCRGNSDAFLVVSGDAVFDFPLKNAIDFHFDNGCDVTVVTSRKENPTQYGCVIEDEENNIVSFTEKPSWKKVRSSLVNTGIYILSPDALYSIPENIKYDFSKNLFPKLIKENKCIKSYFADGFWCDAGTLDEYHSCNMLAAKKEFVVNGSEGVDTSVLRNKGVHVQDGVYVSSNALLGRNVKLSSSSVICSGVVAGDDCDVSSSVVGCFTKIGKGSGIYGAIVGENVQIGENCIISEGCVVGDESRIADGVVLEECTRIPAYSNVSVKGGGKMLFSNGENIFKDDGLCVIEGRQLCEKAVKLSRAAALSFAKREKTGASFAVVCGENAGHLKNAVVLGLVDEGAVAVDCGEGNRALCSYAVCKLEADAGIYLSVRDKKVLMQFFDSNGQPIDDAHERKMNKVLSLCSENPVAEAEAFLPGNVISEDICSMYGLSLAAFFNKLVPSKNAFGMSVYVSDVKDEQNISVKALMRLFKMYGFTVISERNKNVPSVSLNADGTRASIRLGNTVIDHEHICAVVLKNKQVLGIEKMSVGTGAPTVLRNMADGDNDSEYVKSEDFVIGDGAFAVCAFFAAAIVRGAGIEELLDEIPMFEIYTDEYIGDINRAETVEKLARLYNDSKDDGGDGIRLCMSDGNVTVVPGRINGLKIVAEAASMEAARELSVKIENIIKSKA